MKDSGLNEMMNIEAQKEIFYFIAKTFRRYRKARLMFCERMGLNFGEMSTLLILYRYPEITSAKQITQVLEVTKGLASRNIDSLCRKGYIITAPDEKDRRITRLSLSDKALSLCEKVHNGTRRMYRQVTDGISREDMNTALMVLDRMAQNIEKSEGILPED